MNSATKITASLLLAVAAAAWCRAADAPGPVAVNVTVPRRADVHRFVTLPGMVKANQQATLYAKVAGYLTSLAVDKGDAVKAGQSLGEIEVPELVADRIKHQAELEVAKAEFERLSGAHRQLPDLVTPQALDEARGRFGIAQATLERTDTLLRYARLTAPFSGVVTMRHVDPGAFIPAATGGSAAQSAAIVTIADFDTVRVQVPVPAGEALRIQAGQPVKVTVPGLPEKTFTGTISRHSQALDEESQTLLAEASLPNPDRHLRPGMFATVRIGVELHADALTIPVAALVMEKANAFAFIATEGRARKTAVKTGFNDGARVEVLDGLKGGESVILVGRMTLADGAPITATEAP